MRGIKNKQLNERLAKLWRTGRYKSYSSLARAAHSYPKAVERAVKTAAKRQADLDAHAIQFAEESQNTADSLNE